MIVGGVLTKAISDELDVSELDIAIDEKNGS